MLTNGRDRTLSTPTPPTATLWFTVRRDDGPVFVGEDGQGRPVWSKKPAEAMRLGKTRAGIVRHNLQNAGYSVTTEPAP